jgi:hypothetical protein
LVDLEKGLTFPLKDKDWISKIIIGGILYIIPIINFIALGYELKVMKNAINKKPAMPKWENFGNLFVEGLIVFIISLAYMLIPLILFFVLVFGWIGMHNIMQTWGNPYLILVTFSPAIIITGIIAIVISFFLPMAVAMYAKSNDIGKAFKISEIWRRIKSIFNDYLITYVVLLILGIILSLLSLIPFIGIIIALFVSFYLGVVYFNLFGKLYTKSKA